MDNEKDLLRKDLENQNTPEEIKKFVEDAELYGGNEDIVELAKQKLADLEAKAKGVSETSESQIAQVNELGGQPEEVNKRTVEIDQKIEEVKAEATKEVQEVQNTSALEVNTEGKKEIQNENKEKKERTVGEIQNICTDKAMSLKDKIKKLTENGIFQAEYKKLALENSDYSVDDVKSLVIDGTLDLAYLSENTRKEVYSTGDLYKKFENELNRVLNSSNMNEQFDPSSLRELSLAYGGIDKLNVDHYAEILNKQEKSNPFNGTKIAQIKSYIESYRNKN